MKRFLTLLLSVLAFYIANAQEPTRTLPVVYMNTNSGEPITDKENYVPGIVYIDPLNTGYTALGSSEQPVTAQLKGRGNWTWNGFDKKPYKIKFDAKQKVLGMPSNKHWCLLAAADDWLGFMKNPTGFMVSEAVGLRWTPKTVPVELVLNGQYQGLYFLTEHVRVGSKRVNIEELPDNVSSPDSITGGWLVEIDNYWSENNIEFREGNGQFVMVSLREPEILSLEQRQYIENQMYTLNEALYEPTSDHLEQIMDMNEAAKYYLVQEIMEDCESYHGSCMLYKDRDSLGVVDKWKFGPVWDFGNAYDRHQERWIYDGPTFAQYWIGQLASWPVFQEELLKEWWRFYHLYKDQVREQVKDLAALIRSAAVQDAQIWNGTQNYRNNSDMDDRLDDFLWRYNWRINWLYEQWGEGTAPSTPQQNEWIDAQNAASSKMLRNGRILIRRGDKTYNLQGQRVE